MHRNCLKVPRSGFGVCRIQWEWFQVSTISSVLRNKSFGGKKKVKSKVRYNQNRTIYMSCHHSLGATRATLNTQMPPLRRPAA